MFSLAVLLVFGVVYLVARYKLVAWYKLHYNKNVALRVLARFKATAEQIEVNLSQCTVSITIYDNQAERMMLDRQYARHQISSLGYDREVQKTESLCNCVVEYRSTRLGVEQLFRSSSVVIDRTKILPLLELQKHTVLYVSRYNGKQYYLDIAFLAPALYRTSVNLYAIHELS